MVRSLVWLAVVAAAGFGGLRFAEAVSTVDVGLVRLEGQLTVPESRQVQEVVDTVLSQPGPHGAREVAAAIESIGWVREVMVRLRWPDTLHVAVVRDTLAAGWGDDAYLTTDGDVVPVPSDSGVGPDSDLPILSGSLSDGAETMRIYNLLNAQAREIGLRIARLDERRRRQLGGRVCQRDGGRPWIDCVAGAASTGFSWYTAKRTCGVVGTGCSRRCPLSHRRRSAVGIGELTVATPVEQAMVARQHGHSTRVGAFCCGQGSR